MVATIETPVLIAGGGPVGLALALDLNFMGTDSLVVEQDAGTALVMLAKAGTENERTLEFCRRWGLVDKIAACFPDDYPRDNIYIAGSINGPLIGRSPVPSTNDRGVPLVGPEMLRRCGQHLFDPILADAVKASKHGKLHYNTRFESFVQDSTGVTSTLTDVTTGEKIIVRSQYLVGCDGAGSSVRKQLGVPFPVIAQMDFSLSAMVRIPGLEKHHPHGKVERFMFIGPNGTWANMTMVDGIDIWRFTVVGSEEALNPETYDINPVIQRALGRDVPYEVLRLVPWRRAQCLAETYRVGRVLLAGDTTHTTSPTGGHGLNTGIGDATGASWVLNAMVNGWGGEGLLEAYSTERRPVALRNFSNSTQNYKAWVGSGMANVEKDGPEGEAARRNIGNHLGIALHQEWFSQGIGMGYRYEGSPVIAPDGTPEPLDHPIFYYPTSRPGHRAPHAWLADGRSILDLFGRGFVLLRFGSDGPDTGPLEEAARKVRMPFTVHTIDQPEIAALYDRKLVLVRPDGMVAWRSNYLPGNIPGLIDRVRGA
ncbi:MAG: FAD-dependent monooxygenase [Rhodocyclaceae bacterium]|jgi:2-polyprenyl-6-methoxyphenol hydroxylase-like FAD-dependent oxidoreductase|nr:FAD-dependent monooxygenase [Rhodocyclaceae bacterium]